MNSFMNIPTVLLLLLLSALITATAAASPADSAGTDTESNGVSFQYLDRYAVCSFSSNPYGAEIYIDGILTGSEPVLNHYLIAGEHTVRMSKTGYNTAEKTFTVAAGERITIRLNLEEKGSQIPFICLYSYPAGASVILDGNYIGVTPIANFPTAPGIHTVQYTLDGYESVTSEVSAEPGKVASLSFTMTPKANNYPVCNFISEPSGVTVILDGKCIGITPFISYRVSPGAHRIKYSYMGYKDASQTFNAVYDSSADVFMALEPISAPAT
ncbi:MAG: PEGA domain-containing protein [Methanomicrobium sp.]|nr:PEGA domain-containing protein [Methanomicrobium sp.]